MLAFDGLKVVDFTTFVAGSYITLLLSDLGADVIKVEPLDGDPYRSTAASFMSVNRGKRSLAIDLKKDEAKEIAIKLVVKADILTSNARPGVLEKLGLGYESVKKINPKIIYYSSPAHGSRGPMVAQPGFDPLFQARLGLMLAQGGPDMPPMYHTNHINDCCAPVIGAYGTALALLSRIKTGDGQLLETSLTHSAMALQATDFIQHKKVKRSYIKDKNPKGFSATNRLYTGLDGRWFFVNCVKEKHWLGLCKAIGSDRLAKDPRFVTAALRKKNDEELTEILFETFTAAYAPGWIDLLTKEGVPAAMSQTEEELFKDPVCIQNQMFITKDHTQLGPAHIVGYIPKFSNLEYISRRPSPLLGQHTT